MGLLATDQTAFALVAFQPQKQRPLLAVTLGPIRIAQRQVVFRPEAAGVAGQEVMQPPRDGCQVDQAAEDRDPVAAGLLVKDFVLPAAELHPMLLGDAGVMLPAGRLVGFLQRGLVAGAGLFGAGASLAAVTLWHRAYLLTIVRSAYKKTRQQTAVSPFLPVGKDPTRIVYNPLLGQAKAGRLGSKWPRGQCLSAWRLLGLIDELANLICRMLADKPGPWRPWTVAAAFAQYELRHTMR